ncbi:aromatic acid exporter family protein [Streptomyces halstedii]|uniref:FUSC family protein n=1 Tax=Streptomyces TaxID=1883 RepID=UPI00049076EA|nr:MULTISPECIES: aromatic acid exporter family protein [Streptomyces]WSX34240.1 aromatic acid exporter family protein [Streptomyces halstedii]MCW8216942.1 FUSC family protein [Streptomyces griseolus]MYR76787.1 FUSC family protein [Streptomyces sp. SID4925]MYY16900.1 FUSC family protein [Streptomyces sp. SID4912]SBU96869.1 Predicted membrane protein [Streptomyces sp. OspMP-M45]
MPGVTAPAPVVKLVQRTTEPAAAQVLRSTTAAVIAFVVAQWSLPEPHPAPLTAPLTALLVVQVTLYATLTTGIRRVNAVVVGVLIASGFSSLVGLSWWTLGLTIFTSLLIGRLVRVNEFVPEVAISAMLVLGVSQVADTALERVFETLIGAGVGLLFNLLFAPPVWVQTAGASIGGLGERMGRMFRALGAEVEGTQPVAEAAARLHEARRLDHDIVEVDASLRQAEDSLTLNPRVRQGLLHRVVLRTGLDTLEICAVVLRVLTRSLTDLAKARTEEALFPEDVAVSLRELFGHMSDAIEGFAVMITTPIAASGEEAEERLSEALTRSRATRDQVADLLLEKVQEHPRQWQLHGALLAEVDRILDELDITKRSERILEELDRRSADLHERRPRLQAALRRLRGVTPNRPPAES